MEGDVTPTASATARIDTASELADSARRTLVAATISARNCSPEPRDARRRVRLAAAGGVAADLDNRRESAPSRAQYLQRTLSHLRTRAFLCGRAAGRAASAPTSSCAPSAACTPAPGCRG